MTICALGQDRDKTEEGQHDEYDRSQRRGRGAKAAHAENDGPGMFFPARVSF